LGLKILFAERSGEENQQFFRPRRFFCDKKEEIKAVRVTRDISSVCVCLFRSKAQKSDLSHKGGRAGLNFHICEMGRKRLLMNFSQMAGHGKEMNRPSSLRCAHLLNLFIFANTLEGAARKVDYVIYKCCSPSDTQIYERNIKIGLCVHLALK